MSSNSPLVTPLPTRLGGDNAQNHDQSRFEELRGELAALTRQVKEMTAQGAERLEGMAEDGTQAVRTSISDNPWLAMGVAAAAGAVLALAIIPKRQRGFRASEFSSYSPRNIANAMRDAVESRIDTQPMTSRFERLMDQVNNLNLNSASITSSPAYEQAKSVLQGVMKGFGK